MKKTYIALLMTVTLCLTACGSAKDNTPRESSNTSSETTTDTNQSQKETPPEENTPASGNNESQPEAFELTGQGQEFLEKMCRTLNDFTPETEKDQAFWSDFLFYSYTSGSEGAETELIQQEASGVEETRIKVPEQEAEAYAKLVFGTELPRPSREEPEEGDSSCYYHDGYYYISASDFPDTHYTFADCEQSGDIITAAYTISFEDESDAGTVSFTLEPAANENGFIITSKITEFHN